MGETTGIGWLAEPWGHTWSPWRGCEWHSPECDHCYAAAMAKRNPKALGEWGPKGVRVINANWDLVWKWSRQAVAAGEVCKVFPSMCDPFEKFKGFMSDHRGNLTDRRIDSVRGEFLSLTDETRKGIDWLVLTKRPHFIKEQWTIPKGTYENLNIPLTDRNAIESIAMRSNVWLGTSIGLQKSLWRLKALQKCWTISPMLWLSLEPLLEDLGRLDLRRIGWVVIGGESGNGFRNCDPQWFRNIVDQCQIFGVKVFVKQDSGKLPEQQGRIPDDLWRLKEIPEVAR